MTDTWSSNNGIPTLQEFSQRVASYYNANEMNVRARSLMRVNPFMAENPAALWSAVSAPMPMDQLLDNGAAAYGIQASSRLFDQLKAMPAQTQRAVFDRLTSAQQMTLSQQGYERPKHEEDAWYEDVLDFAGGAVGKVFGVVKPVATTLQLDDALNGMIWVGDQTARMYRTIRTMDTEAQFAALAGAAIAVGGLFAAVPTGGLSLALTGGALSTLGTIGGTALVGGSIAAAGTAAATNSTDWWTAFKAAGDGERTFENGALKRVDEILGDPRLINAARDLAIELPENVTIQQMAREVAGIRETTPNAQIEALGKFAERFADPNTEAHRTIMSGMIGLLQMPQFMEAVDVLQKGKISMGRDIADMLNLDQGSMSHRIISGSVDAVAVLALDPFLIASRAAKIRQGARFGVKITDPDVFADRFRQIATTEKSVMKYHQDFAKAVNEFNYEYARRYSPTFQQTFDHVTQHYRNLVEAKTIKPGEFTVEHLHNYIIGNQQMATILQGFGTRRGAADMLVLSRSTPVRDFTATASGNLRAFTNGLTDVRTEENLISKVLEAAEKGGDTLATKRLYQLFPTATHGDLRFKLLGNHVDNLRNRMRATADEFDKLADDAKNNVIATVRQTRPPSTLRNFDLGGGRVVDMDVLQQFDNTLKDTVDEITDIYASAGTVDDKAAKITRDMLYDKALQGEDFRNARLFGRAVGDAIPGAASVGKFLQKVSTMAPFGAWVQLEGPDAAENIRNFVEIGVLADIPQWVRRDYANMMIYQSSPDLRRTAVQSYLENMLRLSGVDSLKEGEDMILNFVNNVRQAYGGGGIDLAFVGDHWTNRALALDEMADGMSMPDFRELNRVMRSGNMAKIMGIVDAPVIEQFQAKVWKPAVLMRIGFIPRAAGEEMFSFMMRGGYGALAQEFGARAIGTARRFRELQELIYEKGYDDVLKKLNLADRQLLERGPLPPGARWVARQLDRYDWASPAKKQLERFAEWHMNLVENGLVRTGQAYERGLSTLAGTDMRIAANVEDAIALERGRMTLSPTEERRFLFGQAIDSIVLGNSYSWRRMALGGVHDDLLTAAERWLDEMGSTIMRAVGSTQSGPIQLSNDVVRTRIVADTEGNMREEQYVALRGQRKAFAAGDDGFENAVHQSGVRLGNDDLTAKHILPHFSRILPADYGFDVLDDAQQVTVFWHGVDSHLSRRVISEFLAEPKYDRIMALAYEMTDSPNDQMRMLGKVLETLRESDMTAQKVADIVLSELDHWQNVMNMKVYGPLKQLDKDLSYFAKNIAPRLQSRTYGQKVWIKSYAEYSTFDMATAMVRNPSSPANAAAYRDMINNHGISVYDLSVASLPPGSIPPRLSYSSMDDMEQHIFEDVLAAHRNPEYSQKLVGVQGLSTDEGFIDKFTVATHRTGVAQVWRPPLYDTVTINRAGVLEATPLSAVTDDDFFMLLRQPGVADDLVLEQKLDQVRAWLDARRAGRDFVLADRQVANAISRALTWDSPSRSTAQMVTETLGNLAENSPKGLLATRVPGIKTPIGWSAPTDTPWQKIDMFEDAGFDARLRTYVKMRFQQIRQVTHSDVRRAYRPRAMRLDDGTFESPVYEMSIDGTLSPIAPDELLTTKDQRLFNKRGEQISLGDRLYFESEVEVGDDILVEFISPILSDAAARLSGRSLFMPKNRLRKSVGFDVPEDDYVELFNSRVEDVYKTTKAIPDWVDGIDYAKKVLSPWDQFVRYGFDKVIGPAIDSLARRPMAFHFFAQRYKQNLSLRSWMRNKDLIAKTDEIAARLALSGDAANNPALRDIAIGEAQQVAEYARRLAVVDLDDYTSAKKWTQGHALAWLRGHDEDSLARMLERVEARVGRARAANTMTAEEVSELQTIVTRMRSRTYKDVQHILPPDMKTDDLLAYLRTNVKGKELTYDNLVNLKESKPAAFGQLTQDDIKVILQAEANFQAVTREAGQQAAMAAINDMIPFIDSHELKTQFAEIGRPFMPFWYAEENFMKRWARTLMLAPVATVRKAQLTYMGLKSAGTIRTDSTGNDWFVWPGSSLLHDAIGKIPGMPDIPVGIMFQSRTDSVLPGFNSRVGTPQFGPLVTLPTKFAGNMFPEAGVRESIKSFEREAFGDLTASGSFFDQIIPATLRRTFQAALATDGDTRLQSAMMTAMAMMEANGKGLPANASAGEVDEYLREVRNWARTVIIAQAIGGWFSPGSLSQLTTNDNSDFWGIDAEDIPQTFNSLYIDLVQQLGIEEGTIEYNRIAESSDLSDLVNPIALTVGRSESRSGAPLPATELAVKFFDDNENYLKDMPYASPWLLPTDEAADSPKTQYAYDQQTINGLRKRITPEEFLNELKFKEGANIYFADRRDYLDRIEQARLSKNTELTAALKAQWEFQSQSFLAAHPVFAQQLRGSGARDRRTNVLREMRIVIDDVDAPNTPMLPLLRQAVKDFDLYLSLKSEYGLDSSARGRLKVERLKSIYESYMEDYVSQNPAIRSFWLGVLRPEAALD